MAEKFKKIGRQFVIGMSLLGLVTAGIIFLLIAGGR